MVTDKVHADNKKLVDKERELAQQYHDMTKGLPLAERKDQAEVILESLKRYFELSLKPVEKAKPKATNKLRRVK